jgi:hypothetical protein
MLNKRSLTRKKEYLPQKGKKQSAGKVEKSPTDYNGKVSHREPEE